MVVNEAVNGEGHVAVRLGEPERRCLTLAGSEGITREGLIRAD